MEATLIGDNDLSFWHDAAGLGNGPRRPPLRGTADADVCVVGAGYTGLWTAWAILRAQPQLRIVLIEAEFAGFGASGRNGGWLSGLMPGDRNRLARGRGGRAGVVDLQRQLIAAVGEVVEACEEEGINADIHVGGTLAVASTASQLVRLRASLKEDREWGVESRDAWELRSGEVVERVRVEGTVGGVFSPHCARIQPAKLAAGLASAVERRGATIFEDACATSIQPGQVATAEGVVRAPWIIRATEGYTAGIPGLHRRLLPMNSSMIVTEPLDEQAWASIGWGNAETLRDTGHAYVYLQRTGDGRIAIGGRGVPYRFGSRLGHSGETPSSTVAQLKHALSRLFPSIQAIPVAGAWSGVLGVARDWCPAIGVEHHGRGGMAWAGGYVGDGVTTSYLAGLTLADLVVGSQTPRTELPWVGHSARSWEPEPFRWLGINSVYGLYRMADRRELAHPEREQTSLPARVADLVSRKP